MAGLAIVAPSPFSARVYYATPPTLQSVAASSAVWEMGRAALEKMFGEERRRGLYCTYIGGLSCWAEN